MNNLDSPITYDILDLIPQRPPIVMIDTFLGIDTNDVAQAALTVLSNNIFVENNLLQEPGIVEHIAQTAAARAGYLFKINNEPIILGFIGSVDKLKIYRLPNIGERLITSISVISEIGDITMISAQTVVEKELIAECRMKIFLKKE